MLPIESVFATCWRRDREVAEISGVAQNTVVDPNGQPRPVLAVVSRALGG